MKKILLVFMVFSLCFSTTGFGKTTSDLDKNSETIEVINNISIEKVVLNDFILFATIEFNSISSSSILFLKGKSYLYQGKWSEAATEFRKVVASNRYSLLPAERYMENFTETNENNEESVYELQYLGQEAFAWGVDIPGTGNMGNFHIDYAPPTKSPDLFFAAVISC